METVTSAQINPISEIKNSEEKVKSPKIKKEKKEKVSTENVIADKLISEKGKSEIVRSSIYIYPDYVLKNKEKEGKKFRTTLRNQLKKFVDTYVYSTKIKKDNEFKKEEHFNKFLKFYKGNYSLNDFSIGSLRESIGETEKEDLTYFLKGLKEFVSKK